MSEVLLIASRRQAATGASSKKKNSYNFSLDESRELGAKEGTIPSPLELSAITILASSVPNSVGNAAHW